MMEKEELKPCPFCGEKPHYSECADYAVLFCSCGVRSPKNREIITSEKRRDWLTAWWNKRV